MMVSFLLDSCKPFVCVWVRLLIRGREVQHRATGCLSARSFDRASDDWYVTTRTLPNAAADKKRMHWQLHPPFKSKFVRAFLIVLSWWLSASGPIYHSRFGGSPGVNPVPDRRFQC